MLITPDKPLRRSQVDELLRNALPPLPRLDPFKALHGWKREFLNSLVRKQCGWKRVIRDQIIAELEQARTETLVGLLFSKKGPKYYPRFIEHRRKWWWMGKYQDGRPVVRYRGETRDLLDSIARLIAMRYARLFDLDGDGRPETVTWAPVERAEGERSAQQIQHRQRVNVRPRSIRIVVHKRPTGRGEAHPNTKLTQAQADEIRSRFREGENRSQLAREFGVSRPTVYQIGRGEIWNPQYKEPA